MSRWWITTSILVLASQLFAAENYLQQGAQHLAAGNYQKAISSYKQVIKEHPDSAEAYRGLGIAYYRLGFRDSYTDPEMVSMSLEVLERSNSLQQDADILLILGEIYLYLDNKKQAVKRYETLLNLEPNKASLLGTDIERYKTPLNSKLVKETTEVIHKGYVEEENDAKNKKTVARCPPGYFENSVVKKCEMTEETKADVIRQRMEYFQSRVREIEEESWRRRMEQKVGDLEREKRWR